MTSNCTATTIYIAGLGLTLIQAAGGVYDFQNFEQATSLKILIAVI